MDKTIKITMRYTGCTKLEDSRGAGRVIREPGSPLQGYVDRGRLGYSGRFFRKVFNKARGVFLRPTLFVAIIKITTLMLTRLS